MPDMDTAPRLGGLHENMMVSERIIYTAISSSDAKFLCS
jgi:hypothetical protein